MNTLKINKPADNYKTAIRLLSARLGPIREEAIRVDGYDHGENKFNMRPPTGFTSVEAMVMDVADVAQALGYFKAKLESEEA